MTILGVKSKLLSVMGGENAQIFISTTIKNYVRRIADSEEKLALFLVLMFIFTNMIPVMAFGQHRYIPESYTKG